MMRTFFLSAILALSTSPAHAVNQTQSIDCKFSNPASADHVLVSLVDPQTGTFSYTTGVADGDDQDTGRIALKRIDDTTVKKDSIQFSAKWSTVQDGDWVTVEFLFSVPKEMIFKPSSSFKATLTTNIMDSSVAQKLNGSDSLTCTSRINSK